MNMGFIPKWRAFFQMPPLLRENMKISLDAVRANKVRTGITICIIAFGIMALVGILTATDSIQTTISSEFNRFGAGTFTLRSQRTRAEGDNRRRTRNPSYLSLREVRAFKDNYQYGDVVSLYTSVTAGATVKFEDRKTHPNVSVTGTDENYLSVSGFTMGTGRYYSEQDVSDNRLFVVLGSDIARELFDEPSRALHQVISVGSGRFQVIGILEEKGSSRGSSDRSCLLPYTTARQYFSRPNMDFSIYVSPVSSVSIEAAIGEAEALFRRIRKLNLADAPDFQITRSDLMVKLMNENIGYVSMAASIIGLITLLGAVVGLMNIMLVSVTERTSEIGTRMAIGAKPSTIKQQFLFEAVFISQLGGVAGIFLGVLFGNIVSLITRSPFLVPWAWMFSGAFLCFLVGVISGY